MKFLMMLFMAALFSVGASYARACGVDSVSGKTDSTITISWDVNCNKFLKVEICWKKAANSGNVCNAPAMAFYTTTGSYTIEGLQPETAYKIKTHWRTKNSAWREITVRIVTTNSPPTATTTMLRYEKQSADSLVNLQPQYIVYFFWQHPPPPKPGWDLVLWIKPKGILVSSRYIDVKDATYNPSTREYGLATYPYSNNRTYEARLCLKNASKKKEVVCPANSNSVEWK